MDYSNEDVQNAIVTYVTADDNISIRDVGSMFSIPKSTLFDKTVKYASGVNNVPVANSKKGRPSILTMDDEKIIADWVRSMAAAGFPITNKELLDSIQHSLNRTKRITAFANNRPTDQWIPKFRMRHNLSLRTPETLDLGKALITPGDLRKWADRVANYLKDKNLEGILEDPTRSFNCDETFVLISPGKEKVLATMGTKDVYLVHKSSAKSGVSVLATTCASGWILPPFIIYPYERSQPWMAKDKMPPGVETFITKKGWMTVDAFCFWLLNQFIPELTRKHITFPIVLYMDGHRSHINIKISDICSQNGIVLICFPPNTTHILQPCDVALFKPLKGLWQIKVNEWTSQKPQNRVTIRNVAHLLHDVWQNLSLKYGQNGFRACGLYPWNPEAVRITKCVSKDSSIEDQTERRKEDSDENNNFPPNNSSEPREQSSSSFKRSAHLEINPLYIGHVILAEFESTLSVVAIDQFVSILEQEENSVTHTGLENLSELEKVNYRLWKGLIQRYFGNISISHRTSSIPTVQKLDLGPVPCVPGKSFRKRMLSSPVLTGENAKRQLAEQERRKQEREKKKDKIKKFSDEENSEDYDEDLDEGYYQYMEMNIKVPSKSSSKKRSSETSDHLGEPVTLTKAKTIPKKSEKVVIIEGSRRSSRLIAKSKVEEKEVEVFEEVVDLTDVKVAQCPEESSDVLCGWCREPATAKNCNQCRICDNFIHETCFPRAILLEKYHFPSFCCPSCVDTFTAERDRQQTAASK